MKKKFIKKLIISSLVLTVLSSTLGLLFYFFTSLLFGIGVPLDGSSIGFPFSFITQHTLDFSKHLSSGLRPTEMRMHPLNFLYCYLFWLVTSYIILKVRENKLLARAVIKAVLFLVLSSIVTYLFSRTNSRFIGIHFLPEYFAGFPFFFFTISYGPPEGGPIAIATPEINTNWFYIAYNFLFWLFISFIILKYKEKKKK